jgi:hypothetical protein
MSRARLMGLLTGLAVAGQALAVGQVSGTYVGNGKEAKLVHAVVVPHDAFNGEAAYVVVMTAQDPGGSKSPDNDALFDKLGDALTVTVTAKGNIIGTQVCHQSLKKKGFSTVGPLNLEGFKIEAGTLSARFFTKKTEEFFGDTWSADLTVKAAMPKAK